MAKKKAKAAIIESPLAEKSLQQIAYCLGFLALQTDALKSKTKNDLIPIRQVLVLIEPPSLHFSKQNRRLYLFFFLSKKQRPRLQALSKKN